MISDLRVILGNIHLIIWDLVELVHHGDCVSGHISEDTTEREAQWIGRVSRALCYVPDILLAMGFNVPKGHSPQRAQ